MRHVPSPRFRLAFSAVYWLSLTGCDTGAVGVDSCRSIEYARCSAAAHCPATFALKSEDSCKRFYRDHCLHGLPLGSDPGPGTVNTCVKAINDLGDCAAQSEDTPATDCGQNSSLSVCQLIAIPEAIKECSFLGSSDAGTSSGGANGTGGATGSGGGAPELGGAPSSGGASNAGGATIAGGAPSTGGTATNGVTEAVGGSVGML